MNKTGNLILALETGIEGGSVSIWDHRLGVEIETLIGENNISKSEDILENIGVLIQNHSINKNEFDLVVLATGIGSATGLKIGEATAKGLAKSFDCRYAEITLWTVLAAVAEKKSPSKKKKIYLPIGKGRVISRHLQSQCFIGEAEITTLTEFHADLHASEEVNCFVYENLIKNLGNDFKGICIRRELANLLGEFASDNDIYIDILDSVN